MDDFENKQVFMGSDAIFNVIEQVASTSSKNEKVDILSYHGKDKNLQKVLLAGLDPTVTYGIQKLPEPSVNSHRKQFDDETWTLIENLSKRVVTGDDALYFVSHEIGTLTKPSSELFKRIILKDFKAGFGDSTVNKAIKGLIPEFPYMRCSLPKDAKLDEWDWKTGVISQEKADGTFTNCTVTSNGDVILSSRQGKVYPNEEFADLISEIKATFKPNTQTHGEILVLKQDEDSLVEISALTPLPREIGNGIMNSVAQGEKFPPNHFPFFQVWEQIPLDKVVPKGTYSVPYRERLKNLILQLKSSNRQYIDLIETKLVNSLEQATDHFRKVLKDGKEGTIMKEPNSEWKDGTSKFQVKRKLDVDVELEVIGFEEGKGKNESTFGSLICKSKDGLLKVSVSGFTDAKRLEIHNLRDTENTWVGKIITVRFNAIMRAVDDELHSLFLPRFIELRNDKTEADSFARIEEQYEAAINEV